MNTGNSAPSTYEVIRTKRDTRMYTDRPIPEEILQRILQAGRMAGSAKHGQWCRFIVVQDPQRKADVAACGDFTAHLRTAPVVVVIATLPYEGGWDPDRATAFDAGRAAQNMMLAAWAEGIASCPVTLHREADALRVLKIPAGCHVAISLAFGYPAGSDATREPRPRLPLEEYVHHEEWGG